MAIFTVGHSTHPPEDFAKLLRGQISTLLDVRSHPTSRWPQFQKENIESWLPEVGIKYEWRPELGGWDKRHVSLIDEMKKHNVDVASYVKGSFPKQRIAKGTEEPGPNETKQTSLSFHRPYWSNTGLWDYSFFMTLPEFLAGCDKLIQRGENEDVAIMCCECLYYKCHRSMISDYLAFRDVESWHIAPHMRQKNKVKFVSGSKLTAHSKVLNDRLERYEPEIVNVWKEWQVRTS